MFMNGLKRKYPIAIVDIGGKEFSGKAEAVVIKDLMLDLIVGPQLYKKEIGKSWPKVCDIAVGVHTDDISLEVKKKVTDAQNGAPGLAKENGVDKLDAREKFIVKENSESEFVAECNTRVREKSGAECKETSDVC